MEETTWIMTALQVKSTIYVGIPKKAAKQMGIEKGSKVHVRMDEDGLYMDKQENMETIKARIREQLKKEMEKDERIRDLEKIGYMRNRDEKRWWNDMLAEAAVLMEKKNRTKQEDERLKDLNDELTKDMERVEDLGEMMTKHNLVLAEARRRTGKAQETITPKPQAMQETIKPKLQTMPAGTIMPEMKDGPAWQRPVKIKGNQTRLDAILDESCGLSDKMYTIGRTTPITEYEKKRHAWLQEQLDIEDRKEKARRGFL